MNSPVSNRTRPHQEDDVNLGTPDITTETRHKITVPVTDQPVIEPVRTKDAAARAGHRRYRMDRLVIQYLNGDLVSVRTEGPVVNADGSEHARTAGHEHEEWTHRWDDEEGLLPEAPEWIREQVAAHPYPAELRPELAAVMRRLIVEDGGVGVDALHRLVVDGEIVVSQEETAALIAAGATSLP